MTKRIYGYWISSRDDIFDVPFESHAEVGYSILKNLGFSERKIIDSDYTVYQFLLKLGYVRVINNTWDDGHCVQYHAGAKLSQFQKEFIADADTTHADRDNECLDDLIINDYRA